RVGQTGGKAATRALGLREQAIQPNGEIVCHDAGSRAAAAWRCCTEKGWSGWDFQAWLQVEQRYLPVTKWRSRFGMNAPSQKTVSEAKTNPLLPTASEIWTSRKMPASKIAANTRRRGAGSLRAVGLPQSGHLGSSQSSALRLSWPPCQAS